MSDLALIKKAIAAHLPSATLSLDAAEHPTGTSWLDVRFKKAHAMVEVRPGKGIGVTAGRSELFGEGSHEFFSDVDAASRRVVGLLRSGVPTKPLREVLLKELRSKRKVTQAQLARALNVQQATVSKIESGSDPHLSTLQRVIAALGGTLELRATFPDVTFQIAAPAGPSAKRRVRDVGSSKRDGATARHTRSSRAVST